LNLSITSYFVTSYIITSYGYNIPRKNFSLFKNHTIIRNGNTPLLTHLFPPEPCHFGSFFVSREKGIGRGLGKGENKHQRAILKTSHRNRPADTDAGKDFQAMEKLETEGNPCGNGSCRLAPTRLFGKQSPISLAYTSCFDFIDSLSVPILFWKETTVQAKN
jgi:hypothetical protein